MKEIFNAPEAEVIIFAAQDIVTTSGDDVDMDMGEGPEEE